MEICTFGEECPASFVALVRVEELRRCIARGDLGKTVILWWGRLLFIFQASLYFFILSLLVRFV